MEDARQHREPREYAATMLRVSKSAEIGSTANHIFLIYNGLDVEFQRDLPLPNVATDLDIFLRSLDDHKHIWWQLASRQQKTPGFSKPDRTYDIRPNTRINKSTSKFNIGQ